jgi:hypothetical protein
MKICTQRKNHARLGLKSKISVGLSALSITLLLFSSVGLQSVLAISLDDVQGINQGIGFFDPDDGLSACGGATSGTPTLVGSDNKQQAYNYLVGQGLNAIAASAVVGNFVLESQVIPTIIQGGGNSDNPADAGGGGWGIAQWTPGTYILSIASGLHITSNIDLLSTQLQIVWLEITGSAPTGYQNIDSDLQSLTDVSGESAQTELTNATLFFQVHFESGGDSEDRITDAQQIYMEYGNSNSSAVGGSATSDGGATSSSGGCGDVSEADCNTASDSSTGLSPVRQDVVCTAEAELKLWEGMPGYPNPAYAADGLLKYTGGTCSGNTCTGGIYEEWCADFVSWVYNQAAYPLEPDPGWMVAGVDSIQSIGQQNQKFHWHPETSNYVPKPGDLAIHTEAYVSHVNIFISSSGGTAMYIGGDQGDGPYGADPPTTIPPNPPSGSNVSIEKGTGYYDNDIIGYVSPD